MTIAFETAAPANREDLSPHQRFCYHCRKSHPVGEMKQIRTRIGYRWRCLSSIVASRQSADLRREHGQRMTASNRLDNQRRLAYVNELRRLKAI